MKPKPALSYPIASVEETAWKMQNRCVSYVWLLRRQTELTREDRESIACLLEELFRCNTPHAIRNFRRDFKRTYSAPPGHCIVCKEKTSGK